MFREPAPPAPPPSIEELRAKAIATTRPYAKAGPSAPKVVDPRRIDVVKSHSIVGALDRASGAGRYEKLVAWLRANEKAVALAALDDGPGMPGHALGLRPAVEGGSIAYGPGCFPGLGAKAYVLGDTHGDVRSLASVLDTIESFPREEGEPGPAVYMLGDALDRGGEGCMLESVLVLAIMQKALPEEFAAWNGMTLGFVKGDHDVALSYPGEYSPEARFSSAVTPADYAAWLNARLDAAPSEDNTLIGRAWIRLMRECPAAAFVDRFGALLSHGGVPRRDVQDEIRKGAPYVFMSGRCSADYEWCRMTDTKNKLLNRASKTSEIGFEEFKSFDDLLGGRIRKFVFGHQHPAGGFERYSRFFGAYDALCISSFRDDSAAVPAVPYFCRLTADRTDVYSVSPAIYVVRLEENGTERKTPPAA